MKQFLSFIIGCFVVSGAVAAPGGRARVSMANQMDVASRATVSRNEISAMAATNAKSATNESASAPVAAPVTTPEHIEGKNLEKVLRGAYGGEESTEDSFDIDDFFRVALERDMKR